MSTDSRATEGVEPRMLVATENQLAARLATNLRAQIDQVTLDRNKIEAAVGNPLAAYMLEQERIDSYHGDTPISEAVIKTGRQRRAESRSRPTDAGRGLEGPGLF